jgi:hypothetical protein
MQFSCIYVVLAGDKFVARDADIASDQGDPSHNDIFALQLLQLEPYDDRVLGGRGPENQECW